MKELIRYVPRDHIHERVTRANPSPIRVIRVGDLSAGMADVLTERERQVREEGWTAEHDDAEHADGGLARAAACYAAHASAYQRVKSDVSLDTYRSSVVEVVRLGWPWAAKWWKPKDPRHDLVRAAALLIAEIERLDHAEARPHGT